MTGVLITGSSGFIGTSFCERFHRSRKYNIVGVDRCRPSNGFPDVEYVTLDLRERPAVRRLVLGYEPEVILHFAAQARVEPSLVDPVGTYHDNVLATVNLIEAALELGSSLERFVYASSETVYGPAVTYPTPEDAALRPDSPYAASKAASELLLRNAKEIPSLILRSAMGYGPRSNPEEQVIAKFLLKALRNAPLLFPRDLPRRRQPTRDVNYVQNYLDAVEAAVEAGVEGVYNVGSGEETSIIDLANEIVDLVGSGSVVFDSRFAYRPGEVGLRIWLDIQRAQEAFGYRPRISRKEGLRLTATWLSDNLDYWSREPDVAPLAVAPSGGRRP